MGTDPVCIACKVDRLVTEISQAAPLYEIRTLECLECRTVLRLVCRSQSPDDAQAKPS
jgi:hypothetical protein